MKILVLGNANSKWIKEFIQYILLPLNIEVTIVLPKTGSQYLQFYLDHGVNIKTEYGPSRILRRIPFFRVLDAANRTFRNNKWEAYDYVINLFVNHKDLWLSKRIRGSKIILYYCGSDVFRKSNFDLIINRLIVHKPFKIFVGSKALYENLTRRISDLKDVQIIRFGISVLDELKKTDFSGNHDCNKQHYTFCIGYNGAMEQQHIKVIKAFTKIEDAKKNKVKIVIPMTYRCIPTYLEDVRNNLDNTGISYRILTEYMNNKQMAQMWSQIDYFINAQTTDSLSASVLESIYAGCTLINGSWLKYPEYDEFQLQYYDFTTFDELFDILNGILTEKIHPIIQTDISKIYDGMSWEKAKKHWKSILFNHVFI